MSSASHKYKLGLIGNCAYMGYIDEGAAVRWLCFPRFDSPSVFGSLLGEKGGHFYIHPASEKWQSKQYYIENTNVLCTEFEAADGKFRVTDFAPRFFQHERYFKPLMFCRKVELLSGNPRIIVSCQPRGNYGEFSPEVTLGSNHVRYLGFKERLRLTANVPLTYLIDEKPFLLAQTSHFVLTWGTPLEAPLEETVEQFLRKTKFYWQRWINRTTIPSLFQDEVIRSALALKLHQYEDSGAIIASGTTSLPEFPGSGRNWDYRYCWLRDSYYTLKAFNMIGRFEELEHYSHFIQNVAVTEENGFQPVYRIDGSKNLDEKEIALPGYLGNGPVRIGNQAYRQQQHDVYGQILLSLLPLYVDKRILYKSRLHAPDVAMKALRGIEQSIDKPDSGIWEFRGKSFHHTYTQLFHWAGSHAAIKIAKKLKSEELLKRALTVQEKTRLKLEACFDEKRGIYAAVMKGPHLDASLFHLFTMGYLDPMSKRAGLQMKALEKELRAEQSLFYRYRYTDDFGDPKVTFAICGLWYIQALALMERYEDAVKNLEHFLKFGNHLGLFSEDIDSNDGSQWGNFPQAYTHVGIINAALLIEQRMSRPNFL